uniref:Uncharacterized protein n=1 Tax=Arundo donax TaxID=35708 RepID=A0A0A8YFG8_ARUDO
MHIAGARGENPVLVGTPVRAEPSLRPDLVHALATPDLVATLAPGGVPVRLPVLRRGVQQAVRIAGLLLTFLEEIQDATMTAAALPSSVVLELKDLSRSGDSHPRASCCCAPYPWLVRD